MGEYELDAALHEELRIIRESVRQLFEQLRLRDEDGDVSGKARLERVPALAKRNFGQLADTNFRVAFKEAWRLIDFLEGRDVARLSPLAREALRVVELDKQLAAYRASDRWKEAALRLRQTVAELPQARAAAGSIGARAREADYVFEPATTGPGIADGQPPLALAGVFRLVLPIARLRQNKRKLLSAASILVAVAVPAAVWHSQAAFNPGSACIAIESASAGMLAEHWTVRTLTLVPRRTIRAGAQAHLFPINDPANGPVESTWTTSRFSYAHAGIWAGPGGGLSDYRLRVGGWADTYLSLLRVPVPTTHSVQKAVVQLTVLRDDLSSRPTSMALRAIGERWRVDAGIDHRLWWRNCPASSAIRVHLPPPGPPDSVYEIDITDLYNLWARGMQPPNGIILEPEHIGRWAPDSPRYSNFSTFYSTRARDPDTRPRLVLTY